MSKELKLSIAVRVSVLTHRKLLKKSAYLGGMSQVVRDLIQAFVEDRITITPPTLEGTIYHVN